jgi:hypothetical protein
MTTTRHAFNHITKHTILIDLEGKPVRCAFSGCSHNAIHIHHETYVCEGGTNTLDNLTAMCARHHIQLHSVRGDFRKWGQKGGLATAASGKSLKNLKQYQNKEMQ